MLAAKFVEAEVKDYLDNYKDEFGQSIDPYFKKTLIALSEQIIIAYEKYRYYVNQSVLDKTIPIPCTGFPNDTEAGKIKLVIPNKF